MINFELYKIFNIVAEIGNITKASEKLNISQPAVTKHIKNLEESLGGPLFIRTKKGVILNEQGKKVYIKIKQAVELIENAEKEFKNIKTLNYGKIKVGISTNLTRKYLFKYIKEFHEIYPNIIIEISTDPTSELIKLLKSGIIDFIVAKIPDNKDNELENIILGKLENIFVVNENYKNLIKKKLDINDILYFPILLQKQPSNSRKTIENYCIKNNIILNSIMDIASSNLLIEFVKAGYGVGFVTKLYVKEELEKKELYKLNVTPKIDSNVFGIIKLKNNNLTYCSKKFIEFMLNNK